MDVVFEFSEHWFGFWIPVEEGREVNIIHMGHNERRCLYCYHTAHYVQEEKPINKTWETGNGYISAA